MKDLLTTILLNVNNNLFLITYMVVEKESKKSWIAFLHYLHEAIRPGKDELPFTFISDRHSVRASELLHC